MAPTRWQQRQFPAAYERAHGVDPRRHRHGSRRARHGEREEELITYVARNLEPYRGFHVFMRAIPEIQRRRPKARIVIVGGDEVSYSPRLPPGQTYRAAAAAASWAAASTSSRVQFLGRIPYNEYLALLRRSSVHVYLTYPFVLSWSLLEAMSAGCLVVGSRTPPVEEVMRDGENGLLTDFFSPEAIAERVDDALGTRPSWRRCAKRARQTVVERYDLKRVCLPAQLELVEARYRVSVPTLVPPQTYSTWPVTKPASRSAKNITARATSSASPSRFTGIACATRSTWGLPSGIDAVEVRGADRPRRHHVHRDAVRRELERPGARHAEHAGLGGRVGRARRQRRAPRARRPARRGRSPPPSSPAAPPASA